MFIGFEAKDIRGDWSREGVRPMHHKVTDPLSIAAKIPVDVELHGDLTYFALLDTDGDQLPTIGELVSGPVVVSKDTTATPPPFIIEKPWGTSGGGGQAPNQPGDGPAATDAGAELRSLKVDTKIRPPFLKEGRVIVVGLPASGTGAYVGPLQREPNFVWASDSVELDWPVEVKAQVPLEGDVVVLLDLDGGLRPSVGDLASDPLINFEGVTKGETLSVTLTGPLTEEGEGGDSGDEEQDEEPPEAPSDEKAGSLEDAPVPGDDPPSDVAPE